MGGLESTPGSTPRAVLELERRSDVDSLAVTAAVADDRSAFTLDVVANTAGQSDALAEVVGSADVQRVIIALAKRGKTIVTFRSDGNTARKAIERVAHADDSAFLVADRRVARLGLGHVS